MEEIPPDGTDERSEISREVVEQPTTSAAGPSSTLGHSKSPDNKEIESERINKKQSQTSSHQNIEVVDEYGNSRKDTLVEGIYEEEFNESDFTEDGEYETDGSEEIEEIEGDADGLEDGMEVELDESEEQRPIEIELKQFSREQEDSIDSKTLHKWERYWRHTDPELFAERVSEQERRIDVIWPRKRRRNYQDLPRLPNRVIHYEEIEDVMNINRASDFDRQRRGILEEELFMLKRLRGLIRQTEKSKSDGEAANGIDEPSTSAQEHVDQPSTSRSRLQRSFQRKKREIPRLTPQLTNEIMIEATGLHMASRVTQLIEAFEAAPVFKLIGKINPPIEEEAEVAPPAKTSKKVKLTYDHSSALLGTSSSKSGPTAASSSTAASKLALLQTGASGNRDQLDDDDGEETETNEKKKTRSRVKEEREKRPYHRRDKGEKEKETKDQPKKRVSTRVKQTRNQKDDDEPTYCFCSRISFGEMIGCDNDKCEIEWFHFECIGLTTKPKGKWFCPNCRHPESARMPKPNGAGPSASTNNGAVGNHYGDMIKTNGNRD